MSTSIKQAINEFLLSCKVEGKSYGTIECYSDKLKGFRWYATNYDWPDNLSSLNSEGDIAGSNGIMFEQDHLGSYGADVNDIE